MGQASTKVGLVVPTSEMELATALFKATMREDVDEIDRLLNAGVDIGSKNKAGHYAYDNLKKIVTFGWIIYPAGYALGYFGGGVDMDVVNQGYNLADFVNKILPGVIVWAAARMDTK